MDRLLDSVKGTATFRGRLYAVPYVTNAGLLYYRRDILDREHLQPPRTWAELEHQAKTLAPKYRIGGYAGQFLPYEGLTVNVTEAVQSAGGGILGGEGSRVTVDSAAAREGLGFLVRGVREGWIPREALRFKEEESRRAFQDGRIALPAQLAVRVRPRVGTGLAGRGTLRGGAAARPGRAGGGRAGRVQPRGQRALAAPPDGRRPHGLHDG